MSVTTESGSDYFLACLHQTNDMVRKLTRTELSRRGISALESTVLFGLDNANTPVTVAEISKWTLREKQSTTCLLHRMEIKGLVTRANDSGWGNQAMVRITNKGREVYSRPVREGSLHRVMSSLSESERQQLEALLRKLLEASLAELGIKRDTPFPDSARSLPQGLTGSATTRTI